jgi:hypothetical protein
LPSAGIDLDYSIAQRGKHGGEEMTPRICAELRGSTPKNKTAGKVPANACQSSAFIFGDLSDPDKELSSATLHRK